MGMAVTVISDLPDEILQCIICLLSTKDAVRTSILAKRWRYFWTFSSVLNVYFDPDRSDTLDFSNDIRFPLLKKLTLTYVTFAIETLAQPLFSGCPVLEKLTLNGCFGVNFKEITIAISTLKILTLNFAPDGYQFLDPHNYTLKVDTPNLVAFHYEGFPNVEILPINLNSVVDAYINLMIEHPQDALYGARYAFQLLSGLSSVNSLTISNETLEVLKDTLHLLPLFHNLTHLHVSWENDCVNNETLRDILPKTPKLEVLDIPTGLNGEIYTLSSMSCCLKSSLKSVRIYDFCGDEDQIEFVKFLLENATVLREIKIACISIVLDMDHIENQLQPSPFSKCVVTFEDDL